MDPVHGLKNDGQPPPSAAAVPGVEEEPEEGAPLPGAAVPPEEVRWSFGFFFFCLGAAGRGGPLLVGAD
jgi:hypothetical protein